MRAPSKLNKTRSDASVQSPTTPRRGPGRPRKVQPPTPSPKPRDGSGIKTRTSASDHPADIGTETRACPPPRIIPRVTRGSVKPVKPPSRSTRNVAPTYVPKKPRDERAPTPDARPPRKPSGKPRAAAEPTPTRRARPRIDTDAVLSDAVSIEPKTKEGRIAREDALGDHPRTLIGRKVRKALNAQRRKLDARGKILAKVVSRRVLVYWPKDAKFYRGTIARFHPNDETYDVAYDDGDEERIDLSKQRLMWEGQADADTKAALSALAESKKKRRKEPVEPVVKTKKTKIFKTNQKLAVTPPVEGEKPRVKVAKPMKPKKVALKPVKMTSSAPAAAFVKKKSKKLTMRHAVALALRRAGDAGMSTNEIVNLVMRDRRLVIDSKSPRASITSVLWNKSKSKGFFVSAGHQRHKLAPGVQVPDADSDLTEDDAYDPALEPPVADAGGPSKDVCLMLSVIGGEHVHVTLACDDIFKPTTRVDESSRFGQLALSPGLASWSKHGRRKPRRLDDLSVLRRNRHMSRLRTAAHTIFKGPKKYSKKTVEKMRDDFRAQVANSLASAIHDADASLARGCRTTPSCQCRICDDPDNPANSAEFRCALAVDDSENTVHLSLVPAPPVCLQIQATLASATHSIGAAIALQGALSIGFRVGIAWPMDRCHYPGKIIRFDPEELRHMVQYDDDGVREYLALWREDIVCLDGATRRGVLGRHAPDVAMPSYDAGGHDAFPDPGMEQSDIRRYMSGQRYISVDRMVTTFGGPETAWVEDGFAPQPKRRGRPPKNGQHHPPADGPDVVYVKAPKMPRHRRCGACQTCLRPSMKKRCEMNNNPIIPRGKNKGTPVRYVRTHAYVPMSARPVPVTANVGYQPDMTFDEFIQWGLPATDPVSTLTDGVANLSLCPTIPRPTIQIQEAPALKFPASADHLFDASPTNVEVEDDETLVTDEAPLARFIRNAEEEGEEEEGDLDDVPLARLLPAADDEPPSEPYEEVDTLITAGWGAANKRSRALRTRGDRGRKRVYALAALNWNTRMVRAMNPMVPGLEPETETEFLPEIPYYGGVPFWRVPRWAHPTWPLGGVGMNYGVVNRKPMRESRKLPRVWRGKDLDMIVFGRDERLEWARKTGMFLARARTALGDRRLKMDAWGGSVLDSIFGALLTQNVSDVLSSCAIMNLAAKFPGPGSHLGRHKTQGQPSPPRNAGTEEERETVDPFDSPPRSPTRVDEGDDSLAVSLARPQPTARPITEFAAAAAPSDDLTNEELVTAATGAMAFMDNTNPRSSSEPPLPPHTAPAVPEPETPLPTDAGPVEFGPHLPPDTIPIDDVMSPQAPSEEATPPPPVKKKSKAQIVREERLALAALALKESDPSPRPTSTYDMIDWRAIMNAPLGDVVECIRCRGMHFMQARRIQRILRRVHDERNGDLSLEFLRNCPVEIARGYLLSLEGYGVKTVSCITLLSLFRADFPVDVNVGRIMARLGWVPLETEQALEELSEYAPEPAVYTFLRERLNSFGLQTLFELHYHMITLGKVFCEKRTPNCRACPLRDMCEYASSGGKHQTDPNKASQDTLGTAASTAAAAAAAAGTASTQISPPISPGTPTLTNPPPSHLDVTNEILDASDDAAVHQTHASPPEPETLKETLDDVMRVGAAWEKNGKPPSGAAAVLRLDPGADFITAKAAHQRLSRVVHPDKCADPRADRAFALITAARNAIDPQFNGNSSANPDSVVDAGAYNVTVDNEIVVDTTPCGTLHDIEDDPTSDARMAATLFEETRGFAAHAATVAASMAASPLQLAVRPPPLSMSRIRHELKAWSLTSELIPPSLLERAPELDVGYYLAVRCGLPSAIAAARAASRAEGRELVPLTVMVPCRAAMNGKFPLHGTYFQTNEVFLDAETAVRPKMVPAADLDHLPTVSVYLGSSVASICRGMSRAEVASSFANRAVCVRSWEPHTGHPRPLPRWSCPFIPMGASLGPAPGDAETVTALRPPPHSVVAAGGPPVNTPDEDDEEMEAAKEREAIASMDETWDTVKSGPEVAAAAAAALRAADDAAGAEVEPVEVENIEDENNEDENGDDTSHHEDGSPATKVRRVSTDEWSSRVLMEYAARRRYAAETAREMARAERRRLRKEEREAARRANVGSREASASSSGATTTTSGGGGGDKKRKASEEAAVPISRFFTPRGSSPSPPA